MSQVKDLLLQAQSGRGSGEVVAVDVRRWRGGRRASGAASIKFEVRGLTTLLRGLEVLGQEDAPFLREALGDIGERLAGEIRQRGRPSIVRRIEIGEPKVGKLGKGPYVYGAVVHPAAAVFEFGRQWWWRGRAPGRIGNNRPGFKRQRGAFKRYGYRVKYWPGWRGEPFVGIRDGGHAIGAVRPWALERLSQAVRKEWERIAQEIEAEGGNAAA